MSPGWRRWLTLMMAAGLCVSLSSCGGSEPMSQPGDRPTPLKGEPTDVDVCSLIPAVAAADILDTNLRVVNVAYGAAKLPTYSCSMGQEFGVPELTVQLTTGPVSDNVFAAAYGDSAGGDPTLLEKLGSDAFFRSEEDQRTLHMLANGAVVSLQVQIDPADPVRRQQVVQLAKVALTHLPDYPRLAPTAAGSRCATVPLGALAQAIGAEPTRAGHLGTSGSLICTWTSNPGSALVTIIAEPERVRAYQRTLDENLYSDMPDLDLGPRVIAMSRDDRAGDLLIFQGDTAMVTISVVPTAGFSDDSISTTPGEAALATQVITRLL